MSEFNVCAGLVKDDVVLEFERLYDQLLAENINPLQTMLDMQNSLQEKLAEKFSHRVKAPSQIATKGELTDFIRDQHAAINDEVRELIESVVGMSRPKSEQSACWKKWKAKYDDIRAEGVDENLTEEDKLERAMEAIDIIHFVMNWYLALGIDARQMFVLYGIKNAANFERQRNGY